DLVQNRVVAEDQRLDFARRNLLGLELGQMILLEQFPQELFDARRVGLRRHEVFELAGRNDARIGQLLDNSFEGNGHANSQPKTSSRQYNSPSGGKTIRQLR